MVVGLLVQDNVDFQSATLPALLPVLSSAIGDTLLLLIKHAGLLINKVLYFPIYRVSTIFLSSQDGMWV